MNKQHQCEHIPQEVQVNCFGKPRLTSFIVYIVA